LIGVDGRTQAGFAVRRLPTPAALAFEALLVNRLWRTNPVNWHYRCLDVNLDLPGWVEQPAGALFMFRRDVWSRLGGFDESFFPLWFEDVDFCQRAANLGYRMYYTPSVVARHTGGHSIQKVSLEKREICWYGNLLGYAYKHFPLAGARVVSLTVFAGSILRMIMGIVIQRSLKPITVYGAVMRLAGRRMLAGPSR
jgi:N-acetylglucosaminyl-diphospho-decaprenol L-rhamnosyltransferase